LWGRKRGGGKRKENEMNRLGEKRGQEKVWPCCKMGVKTNVFGSKNQKRRNRGKDNLCLGRGEKGKGVQLWREEGTSVNSSKKMPEEGHIRGGVLQKIASSAR